MTSSAPVSATDSSTTTANKRRSLWLKLTRWALALTTLFSLLLLGAWWFVLTQIVPKINQWREPLTQQVSKTLGLSVQIEQLSGQSDGWRPTLTLQNVRVIQPDGRVVLALPRITAQLSASTLWPASLWRKEVHIDQLVLQGPRLDIRRDRQGRLHVAGLVISPNTAQPERNPALEWLLDQGQIQIASGTIDWTDELRQQPTMQLTQVDMTLQKQMGLGLRKHVWRLQATPPASVGQRFTATASIKQPLLQRAPQNASSSGSGQRWLPQATRAGDWRSWSGDMSLALPSVSIDGIGQHWPLPFEIQGGRGSLMLSLTLDDGQPSDVRLDTQVQSVSMRLANNLQALSFKALRGSISARRDASSTTIAWRDLSFTTDEGLVWPASQASLQWQHAPVAQAPSASAASAWLSELSGDTWRHTQQGKLSTDRIDIALLARLANSLPMADGLRQQLARLGPQGTALDVHMSWQGPANAPTRYDAQGRLSGLSWQAAPEHPGLAGASLSFKANEGGGQATMAIQSGWAEFPGAFEEPRIPIDTMNASLAWRWTPPPAAGQAQGLEIKVTQATFANPDMQGRVQATWHTGQPSGADGGGRYPGELEMQGQLSNARGDRVWRYLPAVMRAEARHYVRDAVKIGQSKHTTFEVKGPLALFPFKEDKGGLFRIAVDVQDVTLNYVPDQSSSTAGTPHWPAFTQLTGRLLFEGQSMRIENASARLGTLGSKTFELSKVQARIPDLDTADPILIAQGEGTGPLNDLLRFVAVSPVGGWTGHLLEAAQGQGQSKLTIALNLPVLRAADATVSGLVSLADKDQASLRLGPSVPWMQNTRGQVQFTQDGLKVNAKARVWGQEIQVQGSRDAQGVPRFVASGLLSADGLRASTEWPALARLAQRMSGQTPVSVTVSLNRVKAAGAGGATFAARPELQISSSLVGLGLSLPAPLTKDASSAWPLKVVHRLEDAEGRSDSLLMEVAGGPQIKADYRRDLRGATPKVTRGLLSVQQGSGASGSGNITPATLPGNGVTARINLPALDLAAWEQAWAQISAPAGAPSQPTGQGGDALEDFIPDTLSLKAASVSWRQRTLRDVAVTLTHPSDGVWRAQVASEQLAGQIDLRPDSRPDLPTDARRDPANAAATHRVVARLSRLSVPAADAQAFEDEAAAQMLVSDTASVPALDIVIDQFEWRGLPLGKLEVEAVNRMIVSPGNAPLPEWRMTKFRLGNADAQLNATGNWAALGAQQASLVPLRKGVRPRHRAAFSFTLDLNNTGNFLARLGLPQTLKGGKGKMAGQVAWLGSPLEPDPPSMNGEVNVAINEGQFLKADPGVAKLLGVLSLQSLPRRLVLDFRDVFQQGFAFDRIEGDVKINHGVAATRNLRMRGVQALVLMEGQADLAQETQNLRVFVVPEINAGTASLAYAAINPAVGLGTFIAQVLLRKTVVEATTREFTITGSWSDPQVDKVQKTSVPAASSEEANTPGAP